MCSYRIMTQCWQHCPEHRPNFSTILERLNYCTQVGFTQNEGCFIFLYHMIITDCSHQDPDVINTPLPVEYGPTPDDDAVMRPSEHTSSSLTPLLVSRPVSQDSSQLGLSSLGLAAAPVPPQPAKPRLLLHRAQPVRHEVASCCEALEPSWAEPVPASGFVLSVAGSHWLHPESQHRPCSRNSSSSGSQRLKNKTKNLWNPTYGSWVLENFRGKKALAHTQSMPLSTSRCPSSNAPAPQVCNNSSERTDAGCDGASSLHMETTSPSGVSSSHKNPAGSATAGSSKAGMDLAKLQSFPCGNVNYAYDEQSNEAESLPKVKAKVPEAITGSAPSVSSGTSLGLLGLHSSAVGPKLLLKRHASYGHEDVRRHTKAEKPSRDRDSGFSLSEDLSVTPI